MLLALLAVLAIAFMQPLVTFLGGLTLLLGAGVLIFRDLSPASQDAVEQRLLAWLRQVRVGSAPEAGPATIRRQRSPVVSREPGVSLVRNSSRGKET